MRIMANSIAATPTLLIEVLIGMDANVQFVLSPHRAIRTPNHQIQFDS